MDAAAAMTWIRVTDVHAPAEQDLVLVETRVF
jgi:hypothetical protein